MTCINEHVLIRPRFIGDEFGNPTEHDESVFEAFTLYVHKKGLYGYIYKAKFLDNSDGDAESGMCAPQESGEFECTILALGNLIENTELNPEDILVTDREGNEYHDINSLVFDSELPYNDEFSCFSAEDWSTIVRALECARSASPDLNACDINNLIYIISKLY